jgi:AsmA protein
MDARDSSKRNRWILIITAVIVVALVATVASVFLIDVNKFRPILESRASQTVGRTVKLGTLSLSIFKGKLIASDIEVSDDPAFSKSAFLTAKSVEIGVELAPLIFSKRLNVTEVVLDQPQVTLLQSSDGTFNFSSLGKDAQKNGGIPGSIASAALVKKFRLTDGKVMLGRTDTSGPNRIYDDFSVEADDFSFTSSFPFELTTNLPGGGSATLSGNAGPINVADMLSTPFEAAVKANGVNIAAFGIIDPASGIAGAASVDDTVKSDGNVATLKGTLTLAGAKLSPVGTPAPGSVSIKHSADVDLRQQSVKVTQADIGVGKAQLHMTGTAQNRGDTTTVNLQLSGTDVPVDEIKVLLPSLGLKLPTGSHLQGGSLSMKVAVTGTPASPTIAGSLQLANSTLVGFNLSAHLTSGAGFGGAAASAPDMVLSSLELNLKATRAGAQVESISMKSPAVGDATGAGSVGKNDELDFNLLAHPTGGVAGALTKMASVGSGNGATVPVKIGGTLENPIIQPDTRAGARSIAGQTAKGVASVPGRAIGGLFKKNKDKKN